MAKNLILIEYFYLIVVLWQMSSPRKREAEVRD